MQIQLNKDHEDIEKESKKKASRQKKRKTMEKEKEIAEIFEKQVLSEVEDDDEPPLKLAKVASSSSSSSLMPLEQSILSPESQLPCLESKESFPLSILSKASTALSIGTTIYAIASSLKRYAMPAISSASNALSIVNEATALEPDGTIAGVRFC